MRQNHRVEAEQRERMPRAQAEISEYFWGEVGDFEGWPGGEGRAIMEGLGRNEPRAA